MSILIVDNSRKDREQLTVLLNLGGYFDIDYVETVEEAYRQLGVDNSTPPLLQPDLIMMDIFMPGTDGVLGVEACKTIKTVDHLKDIPLFVVTAQNSKEDILLAFEAGAADYITKPLKNKIELLPRVHSSLRLKEEIVKRKSREKDLLELTSLLEAANKKLYVANEQLESMATRDGLTDIPNRRYFDESFDREWRRAVRIKKPISLIMADIDFFKAYNDTYGHLAGDDCLKSVATALSLTVHRTYDLIARYGGEEFVALLPETNSAGAKNVARHMQQRVADLAIAHTASTVSDQVTCSLGIATTVPSRKMEPSDLIRYADQALYLAKSEGRNRFKAYR